MIYVIQCGGKNGPIKIGKTENVEERLRQLQTGCPYELRLLWVYKGNEYSEDYIHVRFSHERIRGEWFHPAKEIFDFVDDEMSNTVEMEILGEPWVISHHYYFKYPEVKTPIANFSVEGMDILIQLFGPFDIKTY